MIDVETQVELEILCSILSFKNLCEIALNKLNHKYFRNSTTKWLFKSIQAFYSEFENIPSKKVLLHKASKIKKYEKERSLLIKRIFRIIQREEKSEEDLNYFISQVKKIKAHCEQTLLLEKLDSYLENMDTENFDLEILKYSNNGISVKKDNLLAAPNEHISSFDTRLRIKESKVSETKHESIKLGYKDKNLNLDNLLAKAFCPHFGLLCSVIGASGVGKTAFCVNLGVRSAIHGFNVFHPLFEGNVDYIKSQYDGRATKIDVWDLFENTLTPQQVNLARKKLSRVKGQLWIEKYQADAYNFEDLKIIKNAIEKKNGIKIHVVICSPVYRMLPLNPSRGGDKSESINKMALYREGRKFADDEECLLMFEDKARTEEWNNNTYTIKSIAYAPSASSELDFLFGISKTKGEVNRKRGRIQLLKDRMGDGVKYEIKVRDRFDICMFQNGW